MEKTKNSRKIFALIGGIVGFGITYFAIQYFLFKPPSFDKTLIALSSELNKSCPIMVDQHTRLDNTMAVNNRIQYNYTLVNFDKSDFNVDNFRQHDQPRIVNMVKTSPEMKKLREHKVTMVYNYVDKQGVFVMKFEVTPDMYAD